MFEATSVKKDAEKVSGANKIKEQANWEQASNVTGCKKHIFETQRQSFYEGTMNLETYVSARDRPKVLHLFDKQTLRELDIKTRTIVSWKSVHGLRSTAHTAHRAIYKCRLMQVDPETLLEFI